MEGWRADITASTRVVALLGHPVGHSRSPLIHNAAFEQTGLNLAYLAFDVAPDELSAAVHGLRAFKFVGANVTIPHKEAVVPLLDELEPLAAQVGAVNTIVSRDGVLTGHNTDVYGFLTSLESAWGRSAHAAECLVLGAGGAARAVVAALQAAGAARIHVYNRTARRGEALCRQASSWGPAEVNVADLEDAGALLEVVNLVVNATPWGLEEAVKLSSLPVDNLHEGQVVMDLVYGQGTTDLLQRAARRGAITIDGTEMLVRQAARAFELWTGVDAPLELMREKALG